MNICDFLLFLFGAGKAVKVIVRPRDRRAKRPFWFYVQGQRLEDYLLKYFARISIEEIMTSRHRGEIPKDPPKQPNLCTSELQWKAG